MVYAPDRSAPVPVQQRDATEYVANDIGGRFIPVAALIDADASSAAVVVATVPANTNLVVIRCPSCTFRWELAEKTLQQMSASRKWESAGTTSLLLNLAAATKLTILVSSGGAVPLHVESYGEYSS
jgi:hypothetical protein